MRKRIAKVRDIDEQMWVMTKMGVEALWLSAVDVPSTPAGVTQARAQRVAQRQRGHRASPLALWMAPNGCYNWVSGMLHT